MVFVGAYCCFLFAFPCTRISFPKVGMFPKRRMFPFSASWYLYAELVSYAQKGHKRLREQYAPFFSLRRIAHTALTLSGEEEGKRVGWPFLVCGACILCAAKLRILLAQPSPLRKRDPHTSTN